MSARVLKPYVFRIFSHNSCLYPVVLPNVDVNSAVYQHLRYLVVAVGDGQVHSGQSVVLLSLHSTQCPMSIDEETGQKKWWRSSLLFGGWNSFNFMAHYRFSTRMDRTTDAWHNECFRKMDNHLVHTIFLQIILAAKVLARHSSTSPEQLRQPLPSLLSVFSSMTVSRDYILNF